MKLIRLIVCAALFAMAPVAFAADVNLTWDNVPDGRSQFTVIERCDGTQMQCDAVGVTWSGPIGQVDLPANTFTVTGLPENTNASFRVGYGNVDFPIPNLYSNVLGVRVPFGGASGSAPANLGQQ